LKIRINKYISEAGICSRRDADRKVLAGRVLVNGRLAELGDQVDDSDDVMVDGYLIENRVQRVYIAFNKPVGVTSTTDEADPDNILKSVGYHAGRIFPIGRLDKDSQGLILLSNDGDIVNKILRVSNKHDKEYIVTVDKTVDENFAKTMSNGVSIMGIMTRKCVCEVINPTTFRIILNQGLNRQIRRMCKVLGYKVTSLQRIRIMNIKLEGIPVGTWRFLTDDEINIILAEVALSKKTEASKSSEPKNAENYQDSTFNPGKSKKRDDRGFDLKPTSEGKSGAWKKSGGDKKSTGKPGSWKKSESAGKPGSWKKSESAEKPGSWKKSESAGKSGPWKSRDSADKPSTWKKAGPSKGPWKKNESDGKAGGWKKSDSADKSPTWKKAGPSKGPWKKSTSSTDGGADGDGPTKTTNPKFRSSSRPSSTSGEGTGVSPDRKRKPSPFKTKGGSKPTRKGPSDGKPARKGPSDGKPKAGRGTRGASRPKR
jgi:23S rRNA pseudouridine2604 synthase